MSGRLFCKFGPLAGTEREFGPEATIGSGPGNLLVLDHPSLSRQQARIRFDDQSGCYVLEDLSGGGTALDGEKVEGPVQLGPLHVITFAAEHDFFFQWNPEEVPEALKETVELGSLELPPGVAAPGEGSPALATILRQKPGVASPPAFEASPQGTQPFAEVTEVGQPEGASLPSFLKRGPQPPAAEPDDQSKPASRLVLELETSAGLEAYPLAEGENTLGRSSECQIFVNDRTLSRRHASLTVASGSLKLRDLGSTNKTFVEGKEIREETEISPGTELAFATMSGKVRLEEGFHAEAQSRRGDSEEKEER